MRKSTAVDADHGGDDSGSRAASQEAALGEEEQAATAELRDCMDLDGKGRRSGARGGGARDLRVAREEERGRGDLRTFFLKEP